MSDEQITITQEQQHQVVQALLTAQKLIKELTETVQAQQEHIAELEKELADKKQV